MGGWNYHKPIRGLPKSRRTKFVKKARDLLKELNNNRLTVVLSPAPNQKFSGHKVRMVESENPEWYRRLYYSYRHFRRDRSINALERIANQADGEYKTNSKYAPYKYDCIYRELIDIRVTKDYLDYYV